MSRHFIKIRQNLMSQVQSWEKLPVANWLKWLWVYWTLSAEEAVKKITEVPQQPQADYLICVLCLHMYRLLMSLHSFIHGHHRWQHCFCLLHGVTGTNSHCQCCQSASMLWVIGDSVRSDRQCFRSSKVTSELSFCTETLSDSLGFFVPWLEFFQNVLPPAVSQTSTTSSWST